MVGGSWSPATHWIPLAVPGQGKELLRMNVVLEDESNARLTLNERMAQDGKETKGNQGRKCKD
jgi:hypothetical protein